MGRTKKVSDQEAVGRAMVLFWRDGYANVSTRQLEEEAGLTRFTLQTTYGGKQALFLRAVDLYIEKTIANLLPTLDAADLDGLADWFENRPLPEETKAFASFGCLVVNSLAVPTSEVPEVRERIAHFLGAFRAAYAGVLTRAQASGTLPASFNVAQSAEFLATALISLNLANRLPPGSGSAAAFGRSIAAIIRGWRAA